MEYVGSCLQVHCVVLGGSSALEFAPLCVISLNVVWQLLISVTLFCQKISKTNSIRFNMYNTSTVYMDNGDRETR